MLTGGTVELDYQFEHALDRTFNRGKHTTKTTRTRTVEERLRLAVTLDPNARSGRKGR